MRLHGILITKDDNLIIHSWFRECRKYFDYLVVVDGSTQNLTRELCAAHKDTIYIRDPETRPTDHTLRHHGWEHLKDHVELGDWIFVCHVDEFYIDNPRDYLQSQNNLFYWFPLLILPHPSEAVEWIMNEQTDPIKLFKHFWWRSNSLPHLEHRAWRYTKEPIWNLNIEVPQIGVIPLNFMAEIPDTRCPLYYHYKCYNLDLSNYKQDGTYANTGLNTGLHRPIKKIQDLFFYEGHPFGDGYYSFSSNHNLIRKKFGNPPRIGFDDDNKIAVFNDIGQKVYMN